MSVLEPREQYDTLPGIAAAVLTRRLLGHDEQLALLANSYRVGRLHHALLFQGPRGIGKATLALQFAQHLIGNPRAADAPETLRLLDQESSDFRQLANGTHLQVLHLSRPFDPKAEKFKTVLTVDEIRRIAHFLSRTSTDASYRIIIIDPADDMNTAAANALLKNLEEPPARTVFILIHHGLGQLLPTVRSRCQVLTLHALERDDLRAAMQSLIAGNEAVSDEALALSQGSVRRALALTAFGGLEIIRMANHLVEAREFDAVKAAKLADAMTGRDAEIQYHLLTGHLLSKISASASVSASLNKPRRASDMSQLFSNTAQEVREAEIYNLDRKQTVFGLISALQGKFT